MERMDKNMENRVWQRVMSKQNRPDMPELQRDNLKPWILASQENAAAYRALMLQLIGKQWEPLRRLETESMKLAQSLRGVCVLRGENPKLTPVTQLRDQPRRALEKCFNRSRKLFREMELRREDPEFGMVFQALQRRAGEHCAVLTELLGKLEI